MILSDAIRHEAVRALLGGSLNSLASAWRWAASRLTLVLLALRGLVEIEAPFTSSHLPALLGMADPSGATHFPHTVVLFGATLTSGWPWATALSALSSVRLDSFCNEGRCFVTS